MVAKTSYLLAALAFLTGHAYADRLAVDSFGPTIPTTVQSLGEQKFLSASSSEDPLHIALAFAKDQSVNTHGGFDVLVKNAHTADVSGLTHVYLKQTFAGREIVNADMNVNVDRFGRVISYGSSFYTGPAPTEEEMNQGLAVQSPNQISPVDAVMALSRHLNVPAALEQASLVESLVADFQGSSDLYPPHVEDEPVFVVDHVPFTQQNQVAMTRKYLITGENRLAPVWDMTVDMVGGENWFHVQMDSTNGQVLQLNDWVRESRYNVFPIGVNDPSDGDRMMVVNPEDKLASPLGWHDQGSAGRGRGDGKFLTTVGNNVFAQSNPDGRGGYETNFRPQGTGQVDHLTFDFPLDLKEDPNTYVNTSITNLFYWNNIIHDLFYQYGFDEKSGNFQEDNFNRGGKAGDAVIANAQDGSGYNNANFATPPDGNKPRMRMYVWTTSRPRRDGDLEAGIIIHEYAHGISTRLTGGPDNSNCLGWGEAGGMGEGWGDTFATLLRMRKEYTNTMEFGMGDYSAGRGIRPYKYSRSLRTNPHVYSYIRKSGYSGVHAIGSVWASMLYEVYWTLVDEYGFDEDWYKIRSILNNNNNKSNTKIPGNLLMMQLVVDGMKLQPCRPTFVDARNAILEADEVLFNGEHVCLLWKAFAKRGLGLSAKAGGYDGMDVPSECR